MVGITEGQTIMVSVLTKALGLISRVQLGNFEKVATISLPTRKRIEPFDTLETWRIAGMRTQSRKHELKSGDS